MAQPGRSAIGGTVTWTDVAPRDGLQNIAATVSTEVKVRLVRGLLAAGAPRVEATSFVSPSWVPQLADAAEVLAALGGDLPRLRVLVPNLRGLELALDHGVQHVLVTIAATDTFNLRNVNRTVTESLQDLERIGRAAEAASCTVDVALSVAFGCPFEGEVPVQRVIELSGRIAAAGVHEVGIADTIGVADPRRVRERCTAVAEHIADGSAHLALHVHDTRGLGVANVLAAYDVGVRHFDGSAGGLGGCPFAPRSTGNVCSEDALNALERIGADTGVDLDAYIAVSEQLARDLDTTLPGKLYRAGIWRGLNVEGASA